MTANQQNAQLSTGPRTAEGKSISRMNAMRHGLTGHILVLRPEEREQYDKHCASFTKEFVPAEGVESQLIQQLADIQWRLNRVAAQESNLIALSEHENPVKADDESASAALTAAASLRANHKVLANIALYEQRLVRTYEKVLQQFLQMEKDRHRWQAEARQREERARMMERAIEVRNMCQTNSVPFRPSEYGFDFSLQQIEAEILRRAPAQAPGKAA